MNKQVDSVGAENQEPAVGCEMVRGAALTAEALAQQTSIVVLLEAKGAVVDGQGAVFQQWAQQGANSLIRRLCGTTRRQGVRILYGAGC